LHPGRFAQATVILWLYNYAFLSTAHVIHLPDEQKKQKGKAFRFTLSAFGFFVLRLVG
jgi:hypothetical protein